MIEVNKRVKIMPCYDLAQMRLSGIAGRAGVVTEQIFDRSGKPLGYMVLFDKSFQGEYLWFVPIEAARDEEEHQ